MILDKILHQKRIEVAALDDLDKVSLPIANNAFLNLFDNKPFVIIAEMKAKSPSEGVMCEDYNPSEIAKTYDVGGADAISVLTDSLFFGGRLSYISQVKKACERPVLCKDFIIDEKQILHARQAGADACLLIVKILSDVQLLELSGLIESLSMSALVEVFDEHDIGRIQDLKPKLIGINNRNLDSLKMDTDNSMKLREILGFNTKVLSLSGVKAPADIVALQSSFDGVLLGTALMRAKSAVAFLQDAQHRLI